MSADWERLRPTVDNPDGDMSTNPVLMSQKMPRLLYSVQLEQANLHRMLQRAVADDLTMNLPMLPDHERLLDRPHPGTLGEHMNTRQVSAQKIQKVYRGYLYRKQHPKISKPPAPKAVAPARVVSNSAVSKITTQPRDALSRLRECDVVDDDTHDRPAALVPDAQTGLHWDRKLRDNLLLFKEEAALVRNRLKLADLFTNDTQEEEVRKNRSLKWHDQEVQQSRRKKSQTIRSELTEGIVDEAGTEGSGIADGGLAHPRHKGSASVSEVESIEEDQHLKRSRVKTLDSPKKNKLQITGSNLDTNLRQLLSEANQLGINERPHDWIGGEILRNLAELEKDHEQNNRIRDLLANQFESYSLRKQQLEISEKKQHLEMKEAQLRNWEKSLKEREAQISSLVGKVQKPDLADTLEVPSTIPGRNLAKLQQPKAPIEHSEFQDYLQKLRGSKPAQNPDLQGEEQRLKARIQYLLERDRQTQARVVQDLAAEERRLFAQLEARKLELRLRSTQLRDLRLAAPTIAKQPAPKTGGPTDESWVSQVSDYPESEELVSGISWVN